MAKPKRKWDYLKDKYGKLPLEAGYQQQLDTVMEALAPEEYQDPLGLEACGPTRVCDLSNPKLKDYYLGIRDKYDQAKALMQAFGVELEALTREFVSRMEEDEQVDIRFTDGVSLGHSVEPYPQVKDPAKLKAWLVANGMEDMLTVNWQTLKSVCKSFLEGKDGALMPMETDGVEIFLKDKLSCRGRSMAAGTTEAEAESAATV